MYWPHRLQIEFNALTWSPPFKFKRNSVNYQGYLGDSAWVREYVTYFSVSVPFVSIMVAFRRVEGD